MLFYSKLGSYLCRKEHRRVRFGPASSEPFDIFYIDMYDIFYINTNRESAHVVSEPLHRAAAHRQKDESWGPIAFSTLSMSRG